MQNKIKRMKYLIHELNEASKRYYNATPEMLDREWVQILLEQYAYSEIVGTFILI